MVEALKSEIELKQTVVAKALERAKHEGLDKDERLANVYNNNLQEFAMKRLTYFMCHEC